MLNGSLILLESLNLKLGSYVMFFWDILLVWSLAVMSFFWDILWLWHFCSVWIVGTFLCFWCMCVSWSCTEIEGQGLLFAVIQCSYDFILVYSWFYYSVQVFAFFIICSILFFPWVFLLSSEFLPRARRRKLNWAVK